MAIMKYWIAVLLTIISLPVFSQTGNDTIPSISKTLGKIKNTYPVSDKTLQVTSEKDKSKLSKLEIDINHLKSDTTRLYIAQRETDKRLVNIASNFLYIPYEAYSIEKIAIPAFKAIVNDRLRNEHHIKYELLCNYRKDIENILLFIEYADNELQRPFVKNANDIQLQFQNKSFYRSYQNYPEWSDTYLGGKISLIEKQLKEFDGNQHKVDFTALKDELNKCLKTIEAL